MTEKQKFIKYMIKEGLFSVSDNFRGTFPLIPSHQKTLEGNHVLIKEIVFCLYIGVNTKEGGLGCVALHYNGVERKKHHRHSYQSEILKKAFCPKTAIEAIKTFETWLKETQKIRNSWKVII